MNKKLQVFVSSTYTDLIEERQTAVQAILDAGHIPAGMELFKAGKSQMKTIWNWIDGSDVYMLILGGRYGTIEEDSGLSYTELEYNYAVSKNMPVFAVILEESFLLTKAAAKGKDKIFEKECIDHYERFKSVVESNIVKFVSNIDQIPAIIHSQMHDISTDPDYNLTGWIKSSQYADDLKQQSISALHDSLRNTLKELAYRSTAKDISTCTNAISSEIAKILDIKAILESSQRIIRLRLFERPDFIKVTTTHIMKFSYIKAHEPYFKLYLETTKQQCESFRVENLTIDSIDYTPQIQLCQDCNTSRGQFVYNVKSDFIPPDLESCDIHYVCSYECPILDFFQTHRLSYPCNHFSVSAMLENDTNDQYSILGSTFSSFSKIHFDDYKASEMHNIGMCNMNLPNWSLPGAGYAITIKRKSSDNHI